MSERVIGYVLLTVGLVIMCFSVWYTYAVVTNRVAPLHVFKSSPSSSGDPIKVEDIQANPSQALMQMQTQIISKLMDRQMNQTLNLGATLFLTYFVMLFGYRLSSLGVQLVRPIQVKLREAPASPK